jgi:hypothetical protein
MAMSAAAFVLDALDRGVFSGLVRKVAVAYVYVRGFLAALDYAELSKQIDAAAAAPAPESPGEIAHLGIRRGA